MKDKFTLNTNIITDMMQETIESQCDLDKMYTDAGCYNKVGKMASRFNQFISDTMYAGMCSFLGSCVITVMITLCFLINNTNIRVLLAVVAFGLFALLTIFTVYNAINDSTKYHKEQIITSSDVSIFPGTKFMVCMLYSVAIGTISIIFIDDTTPASYLVLLLLLNLLGSFLIIYGITYKSIKYCMSSRFNILNHNMPLKSAILTRNKELDTNIATFDYIGYSVKTENHSRDIRISELYIATNNNDTFGIPKVLVKTSSNETLNINDVFDELAYVPVLPMSHFIVFLATGEYTLVASDKYRK